jgi:DNA-binding SARP family transcriptional activator
LGTFQLLHGDQDLAPELLARPTLCFIWLYLLSHSVIHPAVPVHRQLLADETFPGIDSDQQRARLRHRLYAFQRVLPAVIAERIRVEGEFVRLEPAGTRLDVVSLRETAEEWGSSTGLLPQEGITDVEGATANCGGEYLPIWDELEQQLTRGRGAAGEVVRSIRQLVEGLHTSLLIRLAHHHHARRHHGHLIPLLEEVLRRRPDREDAASLLVSAYRETGQSNRAQQLENSYRAGFAPARKQDV